MGKEMWLWTRTGTRKIIFKKNNNLTHFQTRAIQCSVREEVDVNAVTGQYRGRRKRRSGAAAKSELLQWFLRAKTHFSHTVRDVTEGKACPNVVYTPVLLSLTEIFLLYVLQTKHQTAVSHTWTQTKAQNKTVRFYLYFLCLRSQVTRLLLFFSFDMTSVQIARTILRGAPNYSWFYVTRFGQRIRLENMLNWMNLGKVKV